MRSTFIAINRPGPPRPARRGMAHTFPYDQELVMLDPVQVNTYWHTSRDAPPPGAVTVLLGVEDSVLQLIMEGPAPKPADPAPRLTVTMDNGRPLRWHNATTGVGTGGLGGRYLYVAVFEPPPPDCSRLRVSATIGTEPKVAAYVYPTRCSVSP